jgi:nicotinamidase-related amidase
VPAHLAVIDMQRVFGARGSARAAPLFAEIVPRIQVLTQALARAVTFTRFVSPAEPAGAWRDYYACWPFALVPPEAPLYELVQGFAGSGPILDARTFSKWGPELAARVGPDVLVLTGVSTGCCVLSTAVAAADAGVPVRVVADACLRRGR